MTKHIPQHLTTPFALALTNLIFKEIKLLRSTGTCGMGLRNLIQVTPTPNVSILEGAPIDSTSYRQLFLEICQSRSSIRSFLLDEVI